MTFIKFTEVLILAIALSMDAFAVSMCKGLAMKKATYKHGLICGVWFGGFQAIMPIGGFFLGTWFSGIIESFDHWVAFGLLAIIGANMLKEAFSKDCDCEELSDEMGVKTMFLMAVATSIDAMAAGISMAVDNVNIWVAATLIGVITCGLCTVGVKIGSIAGCKYEKKAQMAGGIVLVLLGLKILLEHLNLLPW